MRTQIRAVAGMIERSFWVILLAFCMLVFEETIFCAKYEKDRLDEFGIRVWIIDPLVVQNTHVELIRNGNIMNIIRRVNCLLIFWSLLHRSNAVAFEKAVFFFKSLWVWDEYKHWIPVKASNNLVFHVVPDIWLLAFRQLSHFFFLLSVIQHDRRTLSI